MEEESASASSFTTTAYTNNPSLTESLEEMVDYFIKLINNG
jgi:hypothetical protein